MCHFFVIKFDSFITICDNYYKIGHLLQTGTIIPKCVGTVYNEYGNLQNPDDYYL